MDEEKEFYQWLGERLRTLREKAGLKQKDVAAKMGITAQFLSNIEKGTKISTFQLTRLLKAIGCTTGDVFDEEGKKNSLSPSMATC